MVTQNQLQLFWAYIDDTDWGIITAESYVLRLRWEADVCHGDPSWTQLYFLNDVAIWGARHRHRAAVLPTRGQDHIIVTPSKCRNFVTCVRIIYQCTRHAIIQSMDKYLWSGTGNHVSLWSLHKLWLLDSGLWSTGCFGQLFTLMPAKSTLTFRHFLISICFFLFKLFKLISKVIWLLTLFRVKTREIYLKVKVK